MMLPPWIYGEDGVEVRIDRHEDIPFHPDTVEITPLGENEARHYIGILPEDIDLDDKDRKRLIWHLKWDLLKTALKFFFTGKING